MENQSIYKICQHCGRTLHATNKRQKYCDETCKQKAYRRRLDTNCGTWSNIRAGRQSGAKTRQNTPVKYTCDMCGKSVYKTAAESMRVFCSDSCKQKAYRHRRKFKTTGQVTVTDFPSVRFWWRLCMSEYWTRYRIRHAYIDATIEVTPDAVQIVLDGETVTRWTDVQTITDSLNGLLSRGVLLG